MPDLRWDPLQVRWTLIAPERRARPRAPARLPATPAAPDPDCPFCPGRENRTPPETASARKAGSPPDAPGWWIRAVPNKYPALAPDRAAGNPPGAFFREIPATGRHEVVVDSPDHCRGLADLSEAHGAKLLGILQDRARDFYRDPAVRAIVAFKNHGAGAGASMAHSHLQFAGLPVLPDALAREAEASWRHLGKTGGFLLEEMVSAELEAEARIAEGGNKAGFVVFCPFSARFAYQASVVPWPFAGGFVDAPPEALAAVGGALVRTLRRLKNALGDPPFNAVLQFAREEESAGTSGWRIDILPRLIPLAGLEAGGGTHINEVPPEEAAEALRKAPAE